METDRVEALALMSETDNRKAIEYLNGILARKLFSMASYVLNASPYIAEHDRALWDWLEALRAELNADAEHVGRLIRELKGVLAPGMRDHSLASLNYLSLSHLSTEIVNSLEGDLQFMQDGLDLLGRRSAIRKAIEELIEKDRQRLRELHVLVDEVQTSVRKEQEERKRKHEEELRKAKEAEAAAEAERQAKLEAAKAAAAAKKAAAEAKAAKEEPADQKDSDSKSESTDA